MPAAAAKPTRPLLTVIEGGRSTVSEWQVDEARLELAMRRAEEQSMSAQLFPMLQRQLLRARSSGPTAFREMAAIDHILARHARRWADDIPDAS